MRTTRDRIRHALGFEVLGIALVSPLAAFAFHMPLRDIGLLVLASATLAMVWTYIYNLGFDHVVQRLTGSTQKTFALRIFHTVLFEAGLMVLLLPLIAVWLGVSLWQAFVMDLAFALFYMVYALVYNWAYDHVFPLPEWSRAADP